MAFYIRSAKRSALTFDREQAILERAVPTGVFTGMQAYRGTSGFYISLYGGVFAIDGVVIYDDADRSNLFDLGTPTDNEHHILLVKYNPDTDSEPSYILKSGTYTTPPTLTADESAYGIVLADIYVPSTATSIVNAVIANRAVAADVEIVTQLLGNKRVLTFQDITIKKSGTTYTLHTRDAKIVAVAPMKPSSTSPARAPLVAQNILTDTLSTYYTTGSDRYELSVTPTDRYVIFYTIGGDDASSKALTVRAIETGALSSSASETMLANILGNDDGAFAGQDGYPYRADFKNLAVIAVLDTTNDIVHLGDGQTMRVGDEINSGLFSSYTQQVISTVYGTSDTGSIDIDNIITNIAKLKVAGLDHVYDSLEAAAAAGSGRTITVDAGAVELKNVVDDTAPADKWLAALRVVQNSTATLDADKEERGLDIETTERDSKRIALGQRRPFYDTESATLSHNISASLSKNGTRVEFRFPSGTTTVTKWMNQHKNLAHAESRWVSFPGTGYTYNNKIYRLRVDEAGNYFYLETTDGLTDIATSDFGGLSLTLVATASVWEIFAQVGQTTIVQDLEVHGELTGPGGSPAILASTHVRPPYTGLKSFIEAAKEGDTAVIDSRNGIQLKGYSGGYFAVTTLWGEDPFEVDGQHIYGVVHTVSSSPNNVPVYDADTGSLLKTISTSQNAAAAGMSIHANLGKLAIGYQLPAGGSVVEVWDVESNTMDGSYTYDAAKLVKDVLIVPDAVIVVGENTGTKSVNLLNSSGTTATWTVEPFTGHNTDKIAQYGAYVAFMGNKPDDLESSITVYDMGSLTKQLGHKTTADKYLQVAINDKYMAILRYDRVSNYHLDIYPVIGQEYSVLGAAIATVNLGTACSAPGLLMDEDHVYLSYDAGTYSYLKSWTLPDLTRSIEVYTTTKDWRGARTDLRTLYVYDATNGRVELFGMGRKAGPWKKIRSTGDWDMYPYQAVPANGRF